MKIGIWCVWLMAIGAVEERSVETVHTVKIQGFPVNYRAQVGQLPLEDSVSLSYISYVKEGVDDASTRPITFCFNGGPGSSSIWLHMGLLGPKRVVLKETGGAVAPYQMVDNDFSLLDVTDLVFLDPVSSGYSTASDPKKYWNSEEDLKTFAQAIRLLLTRMDRWMSPKYLCGESYGTARAAALASDMQQKNRLYLNGIIMVSPVLDMQTVSYGEGLNDLPYFLSLPSFTAAAWYHKKLPLDLQLDLSKALLEAEALALSDYAAILNKGDRITTAEREKMIIRLSRLTGLSAPFLERSNLRVSVFSFAKELLADQKKVIGRFDSRTLGFDTNPLRREINYDPSTEAVFGSYTACFNHYLVSDLNWKSDQEYVPLASVSWDFVNCNNQYFSVVSDLSDTLMRNPQLKVFVASGIYDLATPYFGALYTFDHLGLDPQVRKNVTLQLYEGGHTLFTDPAVLPKLRQDLQRFYVNPSHSTR